MTTSTIKYPHILVDIDYGANAFEIMGRVQREMRRAGLSQEILNQYFAEATAGDYEQLWEVTLRWVFKV